MTMMITFTMTIQCHKNLFVCLHVSLYNHCIMMKIMKNLRKTIIDAETFALQAACWSSRGGHTTTRRAQGKIVINIIKIFNIINITKFVIILILVLNRVALYTSAQPADQAIAPLFPSTQKVSTSQSSSWQS